MKKLLFLLILMAPLFSAEPSVSPENSLAFYYAQPAESAIHAIEWRDAFSHKVHKHQNVLKLIETKNYVELFKICYSPEATDEEKINHIKLLVMLGQNIHNQELLHKIKEKIQNEIAPAIRCNFSSLLQELITKDNINTPCLQIPPIPPLMVAANYGSAACAQLLINAGAAINAQAINGTTALYYAADQGQAETLELLLKAKADTDLRHKAKNDTPLTIAASIGHIRCVQLLIAAGANIHAQTTTGKTALHYAATKGHVTIVQLLLKAGANINAQTATGRTALYLAAVNNHHESVELLLKAGADASRVVDICIKNNSEC